MRVFSTILVLALAGCASPQVFRGPSEFQTWMRSALAHPGSNPAYPRFSLAYHGDPQGLHAYFAEALRQAESPEINVEAGEGLSWELQTVVFHIGDARFASALAAEPDRVRSAVACGCGDLATPDHPQTSRLLSSAPKIDFPMLKTYRGDYHPSSTPHA